MGWFSTPAPTPSDVLKPYANALGIYDLVGNVWQLTDSEYEDEHTRFVLLRGGAAWQPLASSDFQNWYFGSGVYPPNEVAAGGAVRLDRHAKLFLMGASFERAATVGFRCAYDAFSGGGDDQPPVQVALILLSAGVVVAFSFTAVALFFLVRLCCCQCRRRFSSTRRDRDIMRQAKELIDDDSFHISEEEDDL